VKNQHKKAIGASLVIGALLLVGGGLAYWKFGRSPAAGAAGGGFEPAEAVQVVEAKTAMWRPTAELSGTVVALQSVTLSNEVAGTVNGVMFESGAVVEAGHVLLTIDSATEEAELRAAEASERVAEADARVTEADVKLAEASVRRLTQAMEAKAVSVAELDQAESALESDRAKLARGRAAKDQAKARVDQMKTTVAKKTLKAPFKARVGMRNVHPGQYLAEGTSVVGLQSVSEQIYLDFALPQDQATRVKVGDVVMANAPMLGSEPLRIEVAAIDATADRTTRNIRVRAVVPNKDQRLKPGMFVDISASVGEPQEFVVVPSTAVRRASSAAHVWLIVPDSAAPEKFRAKQQFVTLGPSIGSDQIVLDGLKVGERIAAMGSFKLRDGALVMIGDAPKPVDGHASAPAGTASKP